jgi:hypothetical protein
MLRLSMLLILFSFAAAAEQEPEGRAAFIQASIAYHQGEYEACVDGYRKTIELHHEVPFSKMMIARCFALKNDVESGIQALDEAAEFEFGNAQLLNMNEEFARLREHARFAEILVKVRANTRPCPNRARRRQFDFWIGEWDVTNAAGQRIGSYLIDTAEDGCLLRESFTAANGSTGQSSTFYDRLTATWRQVWMDANGQAQDFYGEWIDGSMVLRQITYNGGLKSILTFTFKPQPDGTVKQVARRSTDEGVTWTLVADYTYTRKPK